MSDKICLSFKKTLEKNGMASLVKERGFVIVGFSGGADSSCLLYLMTEYCKQSGVYLCAAHVNHMIRGEEADRDERFCRDTAEKLGVPIYVNRIDVPSLAKKKGVGLEEAARDVRYAFFEEISEKLTGKRDGALIATAHNSSDNLETVIMNLVRGTGLHGLCGIQPVRDGRVIRPLIADSGEKIRAWCDENGVEYVVDSTNAETDCTRNIIRHKIVPVLRSLSPSPEDAVTSMTALLREDDDFLASLVADTLPDGAVSVSRDKLTSLPTAVSSRVLLAMFKNSSGQSSDISEKHIDSVLTLACEKNGFSSVSLPCGITAMIDRDKVTFAVDKSGENSTDGTVFTYHGGTETFENALYRIVFSDKPIKKEEILPSEENIYNLSILREFDCDKINRNVTVRYKRDGDAYVYDGHTHKVKKMFTDAKLSEREKRLTPLVTDGDGIIWVPGFSTRDGMRATDPLEGHTLYVFCTKKQN